MPKALSVIDMSAPVCCAPVATGPSSEENALTVSSEPSEAPTTRPDFFRSRQLEPFSNLA